MDLLNSIIPGGGAFMIIYVMFEFLEARVSEGRRKRVYEWLASLGDPATRMRWQQSFIGDFDWCFSKTFFSRRRCFACAGGYLLITAFFLGWFLFKGFIAFNTVTGGGDVHLAQVSLPLAAFAAASLVATLLSVGKSRRMTAMISSYESNSVYLLGAAADLALTVLLVAAVHAAAFALAAGSVDIAGVSSMFVSALYTVAGTLRALAAGKVEEVRMALFHAVFTIAPFVIAIWIVFYATAGALIARLIKSGVLARLGAQWEFFDAQRHAIRNLGAAMAALITIFVIAVSSLIPAT